MEKEKFEKNRKRIVTLSLIGTISIVACVSFIIVYAENILLIITTVALMILFLYSFSEFLVKKKAFALFSNIITYALNNSIDNVFMHNKDSKLEKFITKIIDLKVVRLKNILSFHYKGNLYNMSDIRGYRKRNWVLSCKSLTIKSSIEEGEYLILNEKDNLNDLSKSYVNEFKNKRNYREYAIYFNKESINLSDFDKIINFLNEIQRERKISFISNGLTYIIFFENSKQLNFTLKPFDINETVVDIKNTYKKYLNYLENVKRKL